MDKIGDRAKNLFVQTDGTREGAHTVYHEHPVKILQYSFKNTWIFIFPLLRSLQLIPFSMQKLLDWGRGAWLDLLAVALIFCIGALRWYSCGFFLDTRTIHARSGILLRQETEIPLTNITATAEERPLLLRPLRVIRLRVCTASDGWNEQGLTLLLHLHDMDRLRPRLAGLREGSEERVLRTPPWRVFLLSVLFSSSLSGAAYVAALFSQGGRIASDLLLDELHARKVLEDVTMRAERVFRNIPAIGLTVAIVVLTLWLISFLHNIFRYANFKIYFEKDFVTVHMGIWNRRHFRLRVGAIVFPELRQNLIMKLFGMVSLHIRCPGYGTRSGNLPVLIPLLSRRESWELLERLQVKKALEKPLLRAKSKWWVFWFFVWPGVCGTAALLAVRFAAFWLFPQFFDIVRFFVFMLLIPTIWFVLVRVVSLFSQFIAVDSRMLQLHFSRGFLFHSITVRRENVTRIETIQTKMQKFFGICHLYIVCGGPQQQRYRLTALPQTAAAELIRLWEKGGEEQSS